MITKISLTWLLAPFTCCTMVLPASTRVACCTTTFSTMATGPGRRYSSSRHRCDGGGRPVSGPRCCCDSWHGSLWHRAVHVQMDAPSDQDIPCRASDLVTCSPWWHSTTGVGTVAAQSSVHSGAGWTWRWCEGVQTACAPSVSSQWPGVGRFPSLSPWCCSSADPGPRCSLSPCTGSWASTSTHAPAHLVTSKSSRTRLTWDSASLYHPNTTELHLTERTLPRAALLKSSRWGHRRHGWYQHRYYIPRNMDRKRNNAKMVTSVLWTWLKSVTQTLSMAQWTSLWRYTSLCLTLLKWRNSL